MVRSVSSGTLKNFSSINQSEKVLNTNPNPNNSYLRKISNNFGIQSKSVNDFSKLKDSLYDDGISLEERNILQFITKDNVEDLFERLRKQEGRPPKVSDMSLDELRAEWNQVEFVLNVIKNHSEKKKTKVTNWLNDHSDMIKKQISDISEDETKSQKKLVRTSSNLKELKRKKN